LGNNEATTAEKYGKENEMRIFVAFLVALAVLYYCDVNYNNGRLSDGVISMERSIFHHMGH
jgi:hypothetical protein